jgi:hypothetical protein
MSNTDDTFVYGRVIRVFCKVKDLENAIEVAWRMAESAAYPSA